MNERTHLFSGIGSCHWPCNSPYPCGRTRYVIFNRAKVQTDGEEDEGWYKFDDDKVSIFPKDKIATLDGGGEDSSAYVLLYKSRPLE